MLDDDGLFLGDFKYVDRVFIENFAGLANRSYSCLFGLDQFLTSELSSLFDFFTGVLGSFGGILTKFLDVAQRIV